MSNVYTMSLDSKRQLVDSEPIHIHGALSIDELQKWIDKNPDAGIDEIRSQLCPNCLNFREETIACSCMD